MKNHNVFTFLILLIFCVNIRGQWEILNDGIYGYFYPDWNTIDFVNEDIGWISTGPALLKMADGGETWYPIYLGEDLDDDLNIGPIDFVNETIGWAIDDQRIIRKTDDGGLIWDTQREVLEGFLIDLYAVNESVVFAVGRYAPLPNRGLILKTADGGITWTEIILYVGNYHTLLHSISFINSDTGIVMGKYSANNQEKSVVYRTFNSWQTWEEQLVPEFSEMSDLQFINDSTGYFLASNENYENFLCKTSNMCNSWTIITQSGWPIHSYYFLTIDTVFAVMTDSISTNIVKSTDGGLSWENIQLVHRGSWGGWGGWKKIYFKEDGKGLLLERDGGGQFLWKSNDYGEDWVIQKFDYPLNDVYFFSENIGLLVGGWVVRSHMGGWMDSRGEIFVTIDGGRTLDVNFVHEGIFNSCFFINNLIGFTLSNIEDNFLIHKTDDGGENWMEIYQNNPEYTGYSFWGGDLVFFDENIGWAVGRYIIGDWDSTGAAILGTSDGGENWDFAWKYQGTNEYWWDRLYSINKVGTKVWAVGEGGRILKYTEQDQWQLINSITDLPLRKVFFSDENHGWIAGGYFNHDNVYLKLFKTTDAGASWQEIPDFNYQINDLFFENSTHGWAVGNDTSYQGIILETSDGGENWNVQVEDLPAPLNALHFQGDYGWAVGEKGLVLRTDGVSWVDQSSGRTYPNAFKLFQNYPNPFNPTTTIKFDLPRASKVTLKIYNILGEEVATLFSGSLNSGSHSIEWSRPAGIASGIYFYRLCAMNESRRFEKSKKLLLLK